MVSTRIVGLMSIPNGDDGGLGIMLSYGEPCFHDTTAYLYGDANGSHLVNVGDAVYLINYIFKNGAIPRPLNSGDPDGNCAINVGDAVFMINYVFKNGEAPGPGCVE